jgi:hypothetical protein
MIGSDDDEHVTGHAKSGNKSKSKAKRQKVKTGKPSKSGRRKLDLLSDDDDNSNGPSKVTAERHELPSLDVKPSPISCSMILAASSASNRLMRITDDDIHLPSAPIGFTGATGRMNVPLHQNRPLDWSHPVQLLGDKVAKERVHTCNPCGRLIVKYGRLLPCKHVLCEDCAVQLGCPGTCSQCNKRILKIERVQFPAVFLCSYDQCGRAYLSARDLTAHIQHRHTKKERKPTELSGSSSLSSLAAAKRKAATLAASLQELSKQAAQQQRPHSHHSTPYPPPSLHTIQWTAAVAASTSASLQAKANSANSKNNKNLLWSPNTTNPFARF